MVFQDMMGLCQTIIVHFLMSLNAGWDVGNSPPEFSDRCLAARAPEAQLDGKQQVLVVLSRNRPVCHAHSSGLRPEQRPSLEVLLLWS